MVEQELVSFVPQIQWSRKCAFGGIEGQASYSHSVVTGRTLMVELESWINFATQTIAVLLL